MTQRFPRATPESAGLDPAALDRLYRAFDAIPEVHSAMVLRDGAVVAEGWWHPYAADLPHSMFSVSKSFTAIAVGIAIDEGLIALDDRVVDLLPDDAPADPDEHLAAMRVGHLLSMTSGHDGDSMPDGEADPDGRVARGILSRPVEYEPGTRFVYDTGSTYLLSAIVQRVTGEPLVDYLEPRLFAPLGIVNAEWERSPEGIDMGGFGLSITTEDMAAFGQLLLQRGRWGDRQLVPAEWVVAATAPEVTNGPNGNIDWAQGYGFQFWRCRYGAYRADGAFGQFIVVWPEPRLVFAITGGMPAMQPVLDAIWAAFPEFTGAVASSDAPDAPDAPDASHAAGPLDRTALAIAPVAGEASSALESAVLDVPFALEPNPLGIARLTLGRDTASRLALTPASEVGAFTVAAGHHEWVPGLAPLEHTFGPVVSSAAWVDETTLVVRIIAVETPFSRTFTLRFDADGAGLALTVDQNVSFGPTRLVEARGAAHRHETEASGVDPEAEAG
ncbi:beta-lactamase family protein [Agromyces intestinalis]|uniref:Beta-lactamase family protein n=1 Tax=Agromyces intestinalis TaxID=2592652 RepID=A0A5C1YJR5_9MICO|nr:serine hydrolase domain-containing protein [Agromyces intestinalis]QEO15715.1 beta-lactamase family protein [Agromyces intestinalis]